MSLLAIKTELRRFIASVEPEVLCLKGEWGVGKTHLWNACLKASQKDGRVGLEAYSYVSLFGLNHLSDLRISVFEGRRPINTGEEEEEGSGWKKYVQKRLKLRSRAGLAKMLPGVSNLSDEEVVSLLSIAHAPQQIVCIDDIERRGDSLSVKDVFGFASFLKEDRKCKVIIILNDKELDDIGKKQMADHLEKVVDVSLTMKPTPTEAVSVALPGEDDLTKKISGKCSMLGISNIRAIRRAEKFCRELAPHLTDYDRKTQDNVISSLILFSWARDQPNEAPSAEFLKSLTSPWSFFNSDADDGDEADTEIATWRPLLEEYGYIATDELDLLLFDSVESGYFDLEKIRPLIKGFDAGVIAEKADSSFSEAWALYHDSFSNNEDDVVDAIYNSFLENFEHITPLNVLGTFRLLQDLGHEDKSKKLVEIYVENRTEERAFFDLDQNHFIEGKIDPYFRAAFDRKRDTLSKKLDFKNALLSIGESWSSEEVSFLADAAMEQYYETFKASEGEQLRKILSCATRFQRISNPSDEMTRITEKTLAALKKIGDETDINARRVRRFGIKIDPSA